MDSDGFKVVTRKKRSRRLSSNCWSPETLPCIEDDSKEWTEHDMNEIVRRIGDCQSEIRYSDFFQTFMSSLNQSLVALKNDQNNDDDALRQLCDIVCYGLGNFSKCLIARYQLALLLCMKETLKPVVVHIFDPVFLACEKEILASLDISVLEKNEEGKRRVKSRTLFYLPHCGKALYNNLLWANWSSSRLSHVVIVGNSFTRVFEMFAGVTLRTRWPYLLRAIAHIREFCINNNFRFRDVFNDLSIHVFPSSKIDSLPVEYWEDCSEPVYDANEVEIITNEMMKHFDDCA